MTTPTITLADFLLQRIADDEAVAREAQALARSPWRATYGRQVEEPEPGHLVTPEDEYAHSDEPPDAIALHIARHDPARVLADCAARRAIVELHEDARQAKDVYNRGYEAGDLSTPNDLRFRLDANVRWAALDGVLRQLASAYVDHPDFDTWADSY